jgi:phage terminase large subunit-like protein
VKTKAGDPALARGILNNLLEDGLPAVEMRQGALTMMPALAELERAIVGRQLRHGGHPVLRFCFANAEAERNRLGHIVRLHKPKRWLSIDGAVAAAMAVGRAATGDAAGSIFDSADFNPADFVIGA